MPRQVVKQGETKVTVVHNVYEGADLVRTVEVPLMVTPEMSHAISHEWPAPFYSLYQKIRYRKDNSTRVGEITFIQVTQGWSGIPLIQYSVARSGMTRCDWVRQDSILGPAE